MEEKVLKQEEIDSFIAKTLKFYEKERKLA